MDNLRNQTNNEIDGRNHFTKSSRDLDLEFSRKINEAKKYYYPEDEILFSDSREDLKEYEQKFENNEHRTMDEKLMDDLLLERLNENIESRKLKEKTDDQTYRQNILNLPEKDHLNSTETYEKNFEDAVENTKLNPGTEQAIKEPDPDEKSIINNDKKNNKKHPL